MIYRETKFKGVFLIELEKAQDNRGYFSRMFCKKEFDKIGLCSNIAQISFSHNEKKGTIRGMHYQTSPVEETKIVQCTKGSIYDVIIDLRTDSKTYLKWTSFNLCEKDTTLLYIPKGFAHGFQTLEDNTEIQYIISEFYHLENSKGIRWNDPKFSIAWPQKTKVCISPKDSKYVDFYN